MVLRSQCGLGGGSRRAAFWGRGLVACGLLVCLRPLAAQPTLRVEEIQVASFPELQVKVRLGVPQGSAGAGSAGEGPAGRVPERTPADGAFTVHEFVGPLEVPATVLESAVVGQESSALRLVLLIDSTRSVPPRTFRRSLAVAERLTRSLGSEDQVAVYNLNARAHLRSDFAAPNGKAAQAIHQIRRTGRVTRIYDSLETAIRRAREAQVPNGNGNGGARTPPGRVRSAVVLFTDGRDEGSSITWDDCRRLAELPGEMHIPIFVVLYGRAANSRQFARLAALTGGRLHRGLSESRIEALPREILRSPVLVRRLRVRSEMPSKKQLFPGDSVEVLVTYSQSGHSATARGSYAITWEVFWKLLFRSPLGIFALLLLAAVLLGLVVGTTILASRRSLGAVSAASTSGAAGSGVTHAAGSAGALSPFPAALGQGEDEAPPAPAATQVTMSAREAAARERFGFLRNYSYRMLQDALREAQAYERAQLVQVEVPEGKPLREFDLFLERTVLGSGQWSDIRLHDRAAAPVHARIRKIDHRFVIYDLSTGAPTYLNHRRLLRPRALHDGDLLRIGESTFRFRGA